MMFTHACIVLTPLKDKHGMFIWNHWEGSEHTGDFYTQNVSNHYTFEIHT